MLLAPLGALDLTPVALLVVQAALLAAVAPALYALARRHDVSPPLALAVAVLWLASPLTQWANLFDFHPETAVPLLLVLAALELDRGHSGRFVALAAAASCFKEDVSLVFLAWGVLLAFQGRRRFGLGVVAGAAAWFVLATQVAIPAFGGDLDFYSERFGGDRGASLGSVFVSFVTDPLTTLGDAATPANAKVLLALVLATAGLALLAPAWLLLAVPALAANILSAYSYQHDLHFQYYLVPAAVFAIASAHGAAVLERRGGRLARAAPAVLVAWALLIAAVGPASEELRTPGDAAVSARERAVELVPDGASVAAAPFLVPHLSRRHEIYQLPEPFFTRPTNGEYWTDAELRERAREVEWVVYEPVGFDPFPLTQAQRIPAMLKARGFEEVFRRDGVRVFAKDRGSRAPP